MSASRMRFNRLIRWLFLLTVPPIMVNCVLVWGAGKELRWRPTDRLEIVDIGTSVAILWTEGGGGEVAMDTLPGMIPQFRLSSNLVFIDFPFWLLIVTLMTVWGLGNWILFIVESRRKLVKADRV